MIISTFIVMLFFISLCIIQAGLINFTVFAVCEMQIYDKLSKFIICIVTIMEAFFILFSIFSEYILIPIVLLLLFVSYTNILYKNILKRNIFLTIILSVYFLIYKSVSHVFTNKMFSFIYMDKIYYETFSSSTDFINLSSQCAITLCLLISMLIILKVVKKWHFGSFGLSLIVPVVSLLSVIVLMILIMYIPITPVAEICVALMVVFLFVLTALSYILIYKTQYDERIKLKWVLLKQREELVEKNLAEIETVYKLNNQLCHSLKNSNIAVISLIDNGHYEQAKRLLLSNEHNLIDNKKVYSSNKTLNSILNAKLFRLQSRNVDVKLELMTDLGFVDSRDLCVIFGDLIDNVIDYYKDNENTSKTVIIKIYEKQQNVIIEVSNRIAASVLMNNPSLRTTKEDYKNHGFGIASVREIISKYNGVLDIREAVGFFVVSCIIPITGST